MIGDGKSLVVVGPPPAKMGAPKGSGSLYTQEIADEIIERMDYGETLTRIVKYRLDGGKRERGSFPSYSTIYCWADPKQSNCQPDFVPRFARARLDFHRMQVEEAVDIADEPEIGYEEIVEHSAKNGVSIKRARKDMLAHRRFRAEMRLEVAARMDPEHWSMRLQQAPDRTAGDPNLPPPKIIIVGGLPDEDDPDFPEEEPEAPPGDNV